METILTQEEPRNGAQPAFRFLDLPSNLRQRVYTAANVLGSQGSILINLSKPGNDDDGMERSQTPRLADDEGQVVCGTTWALLLTCRTIYTEVSERVFADNRIFVRFKGLHNLNALHRLSGTAIRAMKSLTIHLNASHGGLLEPCDRSVLGCFDKLFMPLIFRPNRSPLEEWNQVWQEIIRPNLLEPGRLQLHFICDVACFETAQLAVQPFVKETEPVLAGCSIRLSRTADRHLNKLAKMAALKVTAPLQTKDDSTKSPSSPPFRFFDLPSELQLYILSFTDLVAPLHEVEWNFERGIFYRSYHVAHSPPNEANEKKIGTSEPFAESGSVSCWELSHPSGPFCRSCHSAFSTLDCCRIQKPPTQIFLVSKAMRQLALEVFFGINRFVVTHSRGFSEKSFSTSRLPVSFFLTQVVPREGLRHLGFLELVFSPRQPYHGLRDYCAPSTPEWSNWVSALEHVQSELTLSKLTIRVYFTPLLPNTCEVFASGRRDMDSAQEIETIKKSYLDVIIPMKRWRGLKKFFVHLPDPIAFLEGWEFPHELSLDSLEEEAERVVMGYEYNAVSVGKLDLVESGWLKLHRLRRIAMQSS